MFSPKKLIKMASIGRKRIPSTSHSPLVAEKGHFAVYTVDHGCFVIPLSYLHNQIFQELFRMSEEEFGLSSKGPITLPCDAAFMGYVVSLIQGGVGEELEFGLSSKGPITLPCDAAFMGYVVSLIQGGVGEELEKALLSSVSSTRCVGSSREFVGPNMLVCGQ
ncbi:auxin-responsive protein SAUR68-like [Punica granatum]|uniref:Auxin-responsive protein SAUR68-like n=1 Tax=Punica granatum TaxID=22663 RepID=A0A6P8CBQ1_PUNGR|nr:auxin-responsive protein SAUR68-like [Punica granatum]